MKLTAKLLTIILAMSVAVGCSVGKKKDSKKENENIVDVVTNSEEKAVRETVTKYILATLAGDYKDAINYVWESGEQYKMVKVVADTLDIKALFGEGRKRALEVVSDKTEVYFSDFEQNGDTAKITLKTKQPSIASPDLSDDNLANMSNDEIINKIEEIGEIVSTKEVYNLQEVDGKWLISMCEGFKE